MAAVRSQADIHAGDIDLRPGECDNADIFDIAVAFVPEIAMYMQRPDRRHGIGSLCQADCFFHFRFVIHDNSARGIGRARQRFIFRVDCEFAFPGRSGDFQCFAEFVFIVDQLDIFNFSAGYAYRHILQCYFIAGDFQDFADGSGNFLVRSGNILFGMLFLASDPQTSPVTFLGKIYYGMIIGILLVVFRHLTKTDSSFVYVLLIANAVSLHIDLFAENTKKGIKTAVKWLKNTSGSFERVRKEAQRDKPADRESLGDTQEIILPPVNYNMPAVDNKIIKAAKKPPKIVRGKDNLPVRKERKK